MRNIICVILLVSIIILLNGCDKCENVHCQNGGTCSNGSCSCPTGYSGTLCETKKDPCANVTCQNGGTCNNGYCNCPTGYSGTYCENVSVGSLLFWTDCSTGGITGYITVYLDTAGATTQSTITNCYASVPDCEAIYGAYFHPSSLGTHTYKAVANSGHIWRGSLSVTSSCQRVYLHM